MNETQFFTPHNVMWTFAGCLAIYFIADGIIDAVPASLQFVFGSFGRNSSFMRGTVELLPEIAKVVVGVILFNRTQRELLH